MIIKAPWSDQLVARLNEHQANPKRHPYTCPGITREVEADPKGVACPVRVLKATTEGWVCRCGRYTQDWAHGFHGDAR